MESRTLGEIGYEAYRSHTGGISIISGQPIPEWSALRAEIREAWEAGAGAVAGAAYVQSL